MATRWKVVFIVLALLIALALPLFIEMTYVLHLFILFFMYLSLALSFDIAAGHVGVISLAHAAFFGFGGYVAAIFATQYAFPFTAILLLSALLAMLIASILSRPAFRLREISFAIATLGFGLTAQLFINNWVEVTEGPLCIKGIPRPSIVLADTGKIFGNSQQAMYYYLFLVIGIVVIIIYRLLTTWRLGRALKAIGNDEILALSVGVDVLKYKRLTFMAGAAIAGALGSAWVQYLTVACPELMDIEYNNTLLLIVFLGGAGQIIGIIPSALIVSVLPEILRVAPEIRLIVFGVILLLIILKLPDGIAGGIKGVLRKLSNFRSKL